MYIVMIACMLSGLLLAKLFKCFILIPAFVLIIGADLFLNHSQGRGFFSSALELVTLFTSLQIGYLAGALSPVFLSAFSGQKAGAPAIFARAPFSRALRADGRMLGATRNGALPDAADPQRKDTINPAA